MDAQTILGLVAAIGSLSGLASAAVTYLTFRSRQPIVDEEATKAKLDNYERFIGLIENRDATIFAIRGELRDMRAELDAEKDSKTKLIKEFEDYKLTAAATIQTERSLRVQAELDLATERNKIAQQNEKIALMEGTIQSLTDRLQRLEEGKTGTQEVVTVTEGEITDGPG